MGGREQTRGVAYLEVDLRGAGLGGVEQHLDLLAFELRLVRLLTGQLVPADRQDARAALSLRPPARAPRPHGARRNTGRLSGGRSAMLPTHCFAVTLARMDDSRFLGIWTGKSKD